MSNAELSISATEFQHVGTDRLIDFGSIFDRMQQLARSSLSNELWKIRFASFVIFHEQINRQIKSRSKTDALLQEHSFQVRPPPQFVLKPPKTPQVPSRYRWFLACREPPYLDQRLRLPQAPLHREFHRRRGLVQQRLSRPSSVWTGKGSPWINRCQRKEIE